MSFTLPKPPKYNRLWWLRIPLILLAVFGAGMAMYHGSQQALAGLPAGDGTSLGLIALLLPALLVEVVLARGHSEQYIKYLREWDTVRRWRAWRPWHRQEDDDIVH